MRKKQTREPRPSGRRSEPGLTGQIKATAGRIQRRFERERRDDRVVDAALSPLFFVSDVFYIVPNAIYLVVLVALFIITLPIQVALYAWLWFSNRENSSAVQDAGF